MATWDDVERIGLALPDAVRGLSHRADPALDIRGRPFARWREVDGRLAVQVWCTDPGDIAAARARPEVFHRVDEFRTQTSLWAWLDRLDEQELMELLEESWAGRAPRRLVRDQLGDAPSGGRMDA